MTTVTAEAESTSPIIKKCMSSRLIKTVIYNSSGYLLSGEIYDKLFKYDEENAADHVQAPCQLFSGEEAS